MVAAISAMGILSALLAFARPSILTYFAASGLNAVAAWLVLSEWL